MHDLLYALMEIMIALDLFPGADCNLLIAMIFAWLICQKTHSSDVDANEHNRIVQFVCNVTKREQTVKSLLEKNYDGELFQTDRIENSISFFFPYVLNVPDNLRFIDKLFLLYYIMKFNCSWEELQPQVRTWMSKHGVEKDSYFIILAGINRRILDLSFRKKKVNGHLLKCLEILHMFRKDRGVLLEQLCAAKTFNRNRSNNRTLDLSIASDIPAGRKKEHNNMVQGPRPENRIYEEAFRHLVLVSPSAIINTLYYYEKWDDASYEKDFLLEELKRNAIADTLVVNPSPDLIKKIDAENLGYTIAVFDETIKALYDTEFKNTTITTFLNLLQDKNKYDSVLIIINKDVFSHEIAIFNAFSCCAENAEVLISVSESVMDKPIAHKIENVEEESKNIGNGSNSGNKAACNDLKTMVTEMQEHGIHPYSILLIPDEVTLSKPKSKRLLYCRKVDCSYPFVQIFCSDYQQAGYEDASSEQNYFGKLVIRPVRAYVTEKELFNQQGAVKIKAAYDSFCEKQKKKNEEYDKFVYDFSAEIRLPYNLGKGKRPNRKVFYYNPFNLKIDTPSKNKLTKRETESKKKASIEDYIEDTTIDELNDIISKDLNETDKQTLATYTMKTLWMLVRPALLTNPEYNDEFCRSCVFFHGSKFGNLVLRKAEQKDLVEALEEGTGKERAVYIWKQIKLIVSLLIRRKILSDSDVVDQLVEDMKKPKRSGAQEVRDAVDSPCFSLEQQRFLLNYIYEKCDPKQNHGAHYVYEVDSKRVLVAAKFFNGFETGELIPEVWGNISDEPEFSSIAIGQRLVENRDKKEMLIDYAQTSPELKNREEALNPELAAILLKRRDFLQRQCPKAAGDGIPIFLETEPTRKNDKNITRMKLSTAKKTLKEVIDKINAAFPPRLRILPDENDLDTDEILRPFQGDIWKRNFEYSCVNYAHMRGGLLDYIYGRKADLTHDIHYVDYGCKGRLASTSDGYNRWKAKIIHQKIDPTYICFKTDKQKETDIKYSFTDYMRCQYRMKVQTKESHAGTIRVRVRSKHGLKVVATIVHKKQEDAIDE